MSETMRAGGAWLRASTFGDGQVWLEIGTDNSMGLGLLSVEEAVQFSRMIVKAAAEAAGVKPTKLDGARVPVHWSAQGRIHPGTSEQCLDDDCVDCAETAPEGAQNA